MNEVEHNISKNLFLCILYSLSESLLKKTESALTLHDLSLDHKEQLAALMMCFCEEIKDLANELIAKQNDDEIGITAHGNNS